MRGVTVYTDRPPYADFISTHTPHARRDGKDTVDKIINAISTHTPHARRDFSGRRRIPDACISTHTPHARRDIAVAPRATLIDAFQLTRLMRGVTLAVCHHDTRNTYFNSHASCEA